MGFLYMLFCWRIYYCMVDLNRLAKLPNSLSSTRFKACSINIHSHDCT